MEDKIKSIDNTLNSLKRDEEQLIKELDKFNGKYEIENGKLTEPREVTEYKRELEKIRAEIEQKNLQRRRYVLLREKARLADENVVKNLKNMYRNEKNADQMINEMLEQRKQDIESKLAEIENIIGTIDEPEIESPDIDEVLKTMEERRKENLDTKPAESIDLEDLANRLENIAEQHETEEIKVQEDIQPAEESEEPVQPEVEENEIENEEPAEPEVEENEPENEEENKNTITEYMEQEIEKINEVLKSYEDLEKNINEVVSGFEDEKEKTGKLQSGFGKIKKNIDELSRRKLIAETIKGLVTTNLSKAKQEYEAYENESEENEEKLEKTKENIENLDTECENTRKELEKAKNEKEENEKNELIEKINKDKKALKDIQERSSSIITRWNKFQEKIPRKEDAEWKIMKNVIGGYDSRIQDFNLDFLESERKLNAISDWVDRNIEKAKSDYSHYRVEQSGSFEMVDCENEIAKMEKLLNRAEEYVANIEQIEQEYIDDRDKMNKEIITVDTQYRTLKALPEENEYAMTLLKARLDEAEVYLKKDIFSEFSKKKEWIINENKELSVEELFSLLESKIREEKKSNQTLFEIGISFAKKTVSEILEMLERKRTIGESENTQTISIVEPKSSATIDGIEFEDKPEIEDDEPEFEDEPELEDDESEFEDEPEEPHENNEFENSPKKSKLKSTGRIILKGTRKVRRRIV